MKNSAPNSLQNCMSVTPLEFCKTRISIWSARSKSASNLFQNSAADPSLNFAARITACLTMLKILISFAQQKSKPCWSLNFAWTCNVSLILRWIHVPFSTASNSHVSPFPILDSARNKKQAQNSAQRLLQVLQVVHEHVDVHALVPHRAEPRPVNCGFWILWRWACALPTPAPAQPDAP